MALTAVNQNEGAFDPATQQPRWFVAIVYDPDAPNADGTFDIDHFEYQNLASGGPVRIFVTDKRGRLIEETPGTGYTRQVPTGTTRTSVTLGGNLDLAADGSINGWQMRANGPAR